MKESTVTVSDLCVVFVEPVPQGEKGDRYLGAFCPFASSTSRT